MVEIGSLVLLVGLLVGSVNLWWRVLSKQRRQEPNLLSDRKTIIQPLGFCDVLAAILFFATSQAGAGAFLAFFSGIRQFDSTNNQHMTWFSLVAGTTQLIAAAALVFYLSNRYADIRAAGIYRNTVSKDLKLGFAGFLLFVPPMLILQAILTNFWEYEHPTLDLISPDSPLISVFAAWWVATIAAPITEEFLFRVVLLGWLLRCFANPRDIWGALIGGSENYKNVSSLTSVDDTASKPAKFSHHKTWPPVIIVALLFALVHIGQGPAPIPIFFLALGLGAMYRQTGSVVPCIVTHFLLNTFSMAVFTMQELYLPQPQAEEVISAPVGIIEFLNRLFGYLFDLIQQIL